ncbi:hypothetical protein HDU97_000298 [Phlyctochytrium planicorne]|nr:hypothetical protein HDU97_000298 [Phlyctochytrium planicorne]
MTKVFVGNLAWATTDDSLRGAFGQFGNISDAIVLRDRETGRSRGFGFVTFDSAEEAQAAINALNDQDLDGRNVRVNLANERPSGGSGGFGGNRGGFGGNRGGYNNGGGYGGNGGYNNQPYNGSY